MVSVQVYGPTMLIRSGTDYCSPATSHICHARWTPMGLLVEYLSYYSPYHLGHRLAPTPKPISHNSLPCLPRTARISKEKRENISMFWSDVSADFKGGNRKIFPFSGGGGGGDWYFFFGGGGGGGLKIREEFQGRKRKPTCFNDTSNIQVWRFSFDNFLLQVNKRILGTVIWYRILPFRRGRFNI